MPHLYNMQLKIRTWFKKKKILYSMALHTNRLALRVACLALQGYNDAFFHRPVYKAICPGYKIK